MFFNYGTGTNGKSVFVDTISGVLGESYVKDEGYVKDAAMDTFIATHNPQHSTDLAHLRGARLVTATETEEGRRWDEAKLKKLTGGDAITARFMRQDNFTLWAAVQANDFPQPSPQTPHRGRSSAQTHELNSVHCEFPTSGRQARQTAKGKTARRVGRDFAVDGGGLSEMAALRFTPSQRRNEGDRRVSQRARRSRSSWLWAAGKRLRCFAGTLS